ncbi:hypothetical protein KUTeg_019990, partial [Tegillarca granosa]
MVTDFFIAPNLHKICTTYKNNLIHGILLTMVVRISRINVITKSKLNDFNISQGIMISSTYHEQSFYSC